LSKAKINKYIEFFTTKIKILYKEKKFKSNGYTLKYMLEKNDSDSLLVILSGVPRQGLKARYNYGRTLRNISVNKLFILDDFGYDQRGAWYLGKNGDFKIKQTTEELIQKVKSDLNIKNTIYCGSSKGGYNALMFGLEDEGSTIIAGGPQYFLGDRLTKGVYPKYTLPYIMGENYTDKDIQTLNDLLPNIIRKAKGKDYKIFLHYSDQEYMYNQHIKYLLEELKANDIEFVEDIAKYKKHAEIAYFFPSFLVNTLKKEIRNKSRELKGKCKKKTKELSL